MRSVVTDRVLCLELRSGLFIFKIVETSPDILLMQPRPSPPHGQVSVSLLRTKRGHYITGPRPTSVDDGSPILSIRS